MKLNHLAPKPGAVATPIAILFTTTAIGLASPGILENAGPQSVASIVDNNPLVPVVACNPQPLGQSALLAAHPAPLLPLAGPATNRYRLPRDRL